MRKPGIVHVFPIREPSLAGEEKFMRLSQKRRRLLQSSLPVFNIDVLERRQLLSGEAVQTPIPSVLASTSSPSSNDITLDQNFFDSTLPGTLVTFQTTYGEIQVGLTDAATPKTVANFLSYVESGAYNNTIFHRSVDLSDGQSASPSDPGTIIQGGGYNLGGGSLTHIPTGNPVPDEYTTELFNDSAGTLAMAKTSYANSATSEWYFNVSNNTELDTPTTDPNGVTTSYTVFGTVLSGMNVIEQIAQLPTDSLNSTLTSVPVTGLTEAQVQAGATVQENNLVYVNSVTSEPGTTYTVTSDNKSLVIPSISNGVLSFAYGTGSGTADITVTATNLDGTSASDTFPVTVPTVNPSAGPVANPYTAPFTVTGTTGSFSVFGPDTDSLAPLNPASVQITVQPAHGTATVNTSNGFINYTPSAGYIGADSLTYTVSDTSGTVSNPAVVTLYAAPTAVTVNVTPARPLAFTQPDGIVGHVSVTDGTAVVTFTDYLVTTKVRDGVTVATGAGADVTGITVTDTTNEYASLSVSSNGPISMASINSTGDMIKINAPTVTLTGTSNIGFVIDEYLAALNGATLNLGEYPDGLPTNLYIPTVTNSDVIATGDLGIIKSKRWVVTDNSAHTLSAIEITELLVSGEFDNNLSLSQTLAGPRFFAMNVADVGDPTGTWSIAGGVLKATFGTPGSNWSLTIGSIIYFLTFTGDLSNQVVAGDIDKLTVKGTTTNAVVETDGEFSPKYEQIASMSFGGAVSGTVIYSNGSIGSIHAPSLTDSRVYAGVALSVAQNGTLAASASDLASNSSIGSISLSGRAKTAFSNSLISADILGSLNLGKVNTSNGGTAEGISANKIHSLSAVLVPGGVLSAGGAQLKNATTLAAYEKKKKITSLGDFQINFI